MSENGAGNGFQTDFINAAYAASAVRVAQYPVGEEPEIAFIGRSNVGKSSLINALCRHRGLARISGTPGKTQTLNFYKVTAKLLPEERKNFWLVDLPGYGYARSGQSDRRAWSNFTEEYWLQSVRLRLICQLIDLRHPPQESDIKVYKWLCEHSLPVQLVATKADKISRGQAAKNLTVIKNELGADHLPLAFSAVSALGRQKLLDIICLSLLK